MKDVLKLGQGFFVFFGMASLLWIVFTWNTIPEHFMGTVGSLMIASFAAGWLWWWIESPPKEKQKSAIDFTYFGKETDEDESETYIFGNNPRQEKFTFTRNVPLEERIFIFHDYKLRLVERYTNEYEISEESVKALVLILKQVNLAISEIERLIDKLNQLANYQNPKDLTDFSDEEHLGI